jgi:hypothetical protein
VGAFVADISIPSLGSFSWWWIALLLTCAVAFSVAYLLAAYVEIGRYVLVMGLVGGGPLLGIVFGLSLLSLADPEPGCTEECYGRFFVGLLAALGVILWEVGVAIGCFVRYLRVRRTRG